MSATTRFTEQSNKNFVELHTRANSERLKKDGGQYNIQMPVNAFGTQHAAGLPLFGKLWQAASSVILLRCTVSPADYMDLCVCVGVYTRWFLYSFALCNLFTISNSARYTGQKIYNRK